jgi:hypothetical protein
MAGAETGLWAFLEASEGAFQALPKKTSMQVGAECSMQTLNFSADQGAEGCLP